MRKRIARISATVAAFGALAVGGSAFATAAQQHPAAKHPAAHRHIAVGGTAKSGEDPRTEAKDSSSESESASEAEADADAGAQAAACKAAGIDPNAGNVQYDDQAGTCSLDNGSHDGQ